LLPINYAGAALVLLGIGLMVAEAHIGAFGVIGVGGIIAFVIGAIMMFPSGAPGFELSPAVIAATVIVTATLFLLVLAMLLRSRKRLVVTGKEPLLGAEGGRGLAGRGWAGSDSGRDLARSRLPATATRYPRQSCRPRRPHPRCRIGLTLSPRRRKCHVCCCYRRYYRDTRCGRLIFSGADPTRVRTRRRVHARARPGFFLLVPLVQQMVRVDLRVVVDEVPPQDVISHDNVSVKVNAGPAAAGFPTFARR
jgi:hypothetical protein